MDNSELLHKIWFVELEILDEIDRVCTENGLRYSLAYGTLLGAVRHGGFIPWDDDIDIMMPREDYEQLRAIWDKSARKEFILEDDTMFDDYVNNFAKIRKNHTTFLQFENERNCSHHTGIFVDIFPGDRVAPKGFSRTVQFSEFALNLLYNRGYTSGAKGIRGVAERGLLAVVPKRKHSRISNYFGRKSRRWNDNSHAQIVFPNDPTALRRYYSPDLFENMIQVPFQGKKYYAFRDYDAVLRLRYGDYMQLPPAEERVWRHHPIIVDFEKNYDELVGSENN